MAVECTLYLARPHNKIILHPNCSTHKRRARDGIGFDQPWACAEVVEVLEDKENMTTFYLIYIQVIVSNILGVRAQHMFTY